MATELQPATGYVRVSDVGGREGEAFGSPDIQRQENERVARERGYRIVATFTDLDESGDYLDRPGFEQARALCDGRPRRRNHRRVSVAGSEERARAIEPLRGARDGRRRDRGRQPTAYLRSGRTDDADESCGRGRIPARFAKGGVCDGATARRGARSLDCAGLSDWLRFHRCNGGEPARQWAPYA